MDEPRAHCRADAERDGPLAGAPLVEFLLGARNTYPTPSPVPTHTPPSEVRVALLTRNVSGGGWATTATNLAVALAALGYRVSRMAHPRADVPDPIVQALGDAGVDLHLVPARGPSALSAIGGVLRALRRLRPTVLIAHTGHMAALAGLKRFYGEPRLILRLGGFQSPSGVKRLLFHRALPRLDAVVCASHAVAGYWTCLHPEWAGRRLAVIHNGVPVSPDGAAPDRQAAREGLALPRVAQLVGTVGRAEWRKGHQYLIRSLPLLLEQCPDAHCVLAGDGAYRGALQALADRLGLEGRVHFLGWREDVGTVLRALDVFVHPTLPESGGWASYLSRWEKAPMAPALSGEGFGNAVVEAAAAQVPVVATAAGGHCEIVVHGETGLLVPAADERAIARAVAYLLANPSAAQAMGRAGLERVKQRFSLENMGRQYHFLLQALLATPPRE
ncbi:MAG: glycosyltransferase family 4 protein [Armatimonadetes bacterium]|nr:glycosyltransferase family 4 protein [Armatimonadota bacterium]